MAKKKAAAKKPPMAKKSSTRMPKGMSAASLMMGVPTKGGRGVAVKAKKTTKKPAKKKPSRNIPGYPF